MPELPRLLRQPEVLALLRVSRNSLYKWRRAGTFPAHIQLGPNTIVWREQDVARFIEERAKA